MAVDARIIIDNLLSFYDFRDKVIISVGAGGGQFIEYARSAKKVYAVDNYKDALNRLNDNLIKANLDNKFTLIHSEFEDVNLVADVVLFEFCLHEMKNPKAIISQALTMANDILIADHWTDSEWAYIVDEKEKVINSWDALNSFEFKKVQRFDTVQRFIDYEELYQKVKGQGEITIKRIEKYKNQNNIEIPMSYGFAFLEQEYSNYINV